MDLQDWGVCIFACSVAGFLLFVCRSMLRKWTLGILRERGFCKGSIAAQDMKEDMT